MNGGLPALTEGKNEASNLEYIIKHVFLLPKLPQKNDSAPERDASLLIACEEALDSFKNYFHAAELRKWLICKKMVQDMLKSRGPSGAFRQEEIERLLGTIGDEGDFLSSLLQRVLADFFVIQMCSPFSFGPRTLVLYYENGRTELFLKCSSYLLQPRQP